MGTLPMHWCNGMPLSSPKWSTQCPQSSHLPVLRAHAHSRTHLRKSLLDQAWHCSDVSCFSLCPSSCRLPSAYSVPTDYQLFRKEGSRTKAFSFANEHFKSFKAQLIITSTKNGAAGVAG